MRSFIQRSILRQWIIGGYIVYMAHTMRNESNPNTVRTKQDETTYREKKRNERNKTTDKIVRGNLKRM
jgi:hypothetical protein